MVAFVEDVYKISLILSRQNYDNNVTSQFREPKSVGWLRNVGLFKQSFNNKIGEIQSLTKIGYDMIWSSIYSSTYSAVAHWM